MYILWGLTLKVHYSLKIPEPMATPHTHTQINVWSLPLSFCCWPLLFEEYDLVPQEPMLLQAKQPLLLMNWFQDTAASLVLSGLQTISLK